MIQVDEALIARRMGEYLRSPDGEAVYQEFELPSWVGAIISLLTLGVGLCQLPTIIWSKMGLKNVVDGLSLTAYHQCTTEARKRPELIKVRIMHGVIANVHTGRGTLLGSFQHGVDHDRLAKTALKLSEIYHQGPGRAEYEPLHQLVSDDVYVGNRRRPLPPPFDKHAAPVLFDLEFNPQDGQDSPYHSRLYALAMLVTEDENEGRGSIKQIPWAVVEPAVRW